jgi:sulfite reductase (NADPH) hemoprotein beta-component
MNGIGGVALALPGQGTKAPSAVETIKVNSRYLRGDVLQELADPVTGGVSENARQILKFHGTYLQDDRDLRTERQRQKLEPAYQFMVRIRAPGGIVTPKQWLSIDSLAESHADGSIRLTTRQAIQLHGVLKRHLKETIAAVNRTLLSTLAACGDVNRNVMCSPNPYESALHAEVYAWCVRLSEHLAPRTRAYYEIWLDDVKVVDSRQDEEPLYGARYLPRKFKIAIAVPPSNDVDVFAHDLGFIAIAGEGRLAGFNVTVGGGMGWTYGERGTYPEIGTVIGFCRPEDVIPVAEQVVTIQRDFGDRSDRKRARLKYTIADRGLEWFDGQLTSRLGYRLEEPRPFRFTGTGDRFGWTDGINGCSHLTLFVENGRIRGRFREGLRVLAQVHDGDFRLTPNQNLIVGNISPRKRSEVEAIVREYGLERPDLTPVRKRALACVALPTCGLAMAEAERYLPKLLGEVERLMAAAGIEREEITVRMSGCPNGCSRPYLAEIGFTGKAPGKYNLYLGGSVAGERLNCLYRENIGEDQILAALAPILQHYAREHLPDERFGDFVIRAGYVRPVLSGKMFHD